MDIALEEFEGGEELEDVVEGPPHSREKQRENPRGGSQVNAVVRPYLRRHLWA